MKNATHLWQPWVRRIFVVTLIMLLHTAAVCADSNETSNTNAADTGQIPQSPRFFDWMPAGSAVDSCAFCFRGRTAPECAYFMILESGMYYRLTNHPLQPLRNDDRLLFDWEAGVMRNHSARTSYGLATRLSYNFLYETAQVVLVARYRYWLNPDIRLDFGLGPAFANYAGHRYTLVGSASLNIADWAAISSRLDIADKSDGSGLDIALYGGINACSYGSLVAVGAEAVVLVIAFVAAQSAGALALS